MLRAILGVIVGFFVIMGVIDGAVSVAWIIFGVDVLFKESVWDVSLVWLILSIFSYLAAGLISGSVCEVIASKGTRAAILLAGIILITLSLEANYLRKNTIAHNQQTRQAGATRIDAMQFARIPNLAMFGNPVLAVIGVLVGGEIIRRKGAAPVT